MDLSSWHVDDSNARELHTKVTDATGHANRAYTLRATRAFEPQIEGFFGVSFEGLLWCIWGSSFCIIYLHRHFSFLWKVLKGLKTFCWTITSERLFLAKKRSKRFQHLLTILSAWAEIAKLSGKRCWTPPLKWVWLRERVRALILHTYSKRLRVISNCWKFILHLATSDCIWWQ